LYIYKQLASGKYHVDVNLMASPGRLAEMLEDLRRIGGITLLQEPDIGYVNARVPIARVTELERWTLLSAWNVEVDIWHELLGTGDTSNSAHLSDIPRAGPDANTPRDNPYTAERATESALFKSLNPTYDGRGTTIGSFEGPNPFSPALQQAQTLDGSPIATSRRATPLTPRSPSA